MNWPALTINLTPDTGADLLVAGIIHTTYPPGPTVRADAIKEAQRLAAAYRRTIPVTCNEPGAQYRLVITPDGTINDVTNPKMGAVNHEVDTPLIDGTGGVGCLDEDVGRRNSKRIRRSGYSNPRSRGARVNRPPATYGTTNPSPK